MKWRVSERENGKPVAWTCRFGPLELLLRWHVVDALTDRQWWTLFMLPSPPFFGWSSGSDSDPEEPTFSPDLKRRQVSAAQHAAVDFAMERIKPFVDAYLELAKAAQ